MVMPTQKYKIGTIEAVKNGMDAKIMNARMVQMKLLPMVNPSLSG